MTGQHTNNGSYKCVEDGVWTALPVPPPDSLDAFALDLATVDPAENERIQTSGVMTFHAIGCTGDFSDHAPQLAVAQAMETQVSATGSSGSENGPATSSFLFHLGDVVYKPDQKDASDGDDEKQMYNAQFYGPYTGYGRCIFAIAGNHDGKISTHQKTSAIDHFLLNFCVQTPGKSPDNDTDQRPAMTQPYVYWRLDTPLAYFIGLYSNIANGGILDDPSQPDQDPQYQWLVAQLKDVQARNAETTSRKAVLLAVHYPPYSGAGNFAQRGDPTLGPTQAKNARPLGAVLQQAFAESGQRPDAVLSAHAHLYQRLTYRHADGWEIPYLVVGSGGHAPVEDLWEQCSGQVGPPQSPPFGAVLPPGLTIPAGESAQVVAYKAHPKNTPPSPNYEDFGFARLTITANTLTGEFFTAGAGSPTLEDSFTLDLTTHQIGSLVHR